MNVKWLGVVASAALSLSASLSTGVFAETPPAVIHLGGVGSGFGKPFGTGIFGIAQVRQTIEEELKGENVKIDWAYLTGTGPAINEALANGHLDFAQYGSLPSIIAYANALPTRFIMSGGLTNIYGMARSDVPIKSIADLKGRKVTLQTATILHWSLLTVLHDAGLSDRDVTIVDLKTPDQLPALSAGSADAVFGVSNIITARDAGLLNEFYNTRTGNLTATGPSGIFVTDSFAKAYPETTERVVRGLLKADYWLAQPENHEAAVAIWAQTGIPEKSIQEDTTGRPLRDQFNPRIDAFVRAQYQSGAVFARTEKMTRRDADIASWFWSEPLDRALKETGLSQFWPERDTAGRPVS